MTFSAVELVVLGILAVSSFAAGWLLRRFGAKSTEAELHALVFEAKGALPRLETELRNRDEYIATLWDELEAWKTRAADAEHLRETEQGLRAELIEAEKRDDAPDASAADAAQMAVLEAEIAVRDREMAELEQRLEDQAQHRLKLEASLTQRNEAMTLLKRETGKWQARVPKLAELVRKRDKTLAERDAEIARLTAAAEQRTRETDEARREAERSCEALGEARAEAQRLEQDVQRVEREMAAAAQSAAKRIAALEQTIETLNAALAERTGQLETLQASQAEISSAFEAKLARTLDLGRQELDAQGLEISGLREALATQESCVTELEETLERTRREKESTRREKDDAQSAAAEAEQSRKMAADALEAAERRLSESWAAGERLELKLQSLAEELTTQTEAAATLRAQTDEQRAEREALRAEVRDWHTRMAPLKELLKRRDALIVEREARIASLEDQLSRVENQLKDKSERLATLRRETADQPATLSAAPDAGSPAELSELTRAVEQRDRTIVALEKKNAQQSKSIEVLGQQLEDARRTNEKAMAKLREESAGHAEPTRHVAVEVSPDLLMGGSPEDADDLKQIRGIGAAFAKRLNGIGIYRFTQLAALTAGEIAWLEDELDMYPGRVERDDWVGQASRLSAAHLAARFANSARDAMMRLNPS